MKNNYKIFIFAFITLIMFFVIFKNFNKENDIEKKAMNFCIKNNYEYRKISNSDGYINYACIVNGDSINAVEYYKKNK